MPFLPSTHRLRLGLPGYLIPFAPLAFAPQRQKRSSRSLSPPAFLPISTHFTAPPEVPSTPTPLEQGSMKGYSTVEPIGFHPSLASPPTRSLSPIIPNNVRTVRLTAAAGTNLARASSGVHSNLFPPNRCLQPEGLLPPRGVARSGLRPLPKILDCSLP